MANYQSTEPTPDPRQGQVRTRRYGLESVQRENGAQGAPSPMIYRLRRVWNRTQERLGFGNNRQPTPSLNEELRQGREEVLSIGRDLADLGQDLRELGQQEMLLARTEMKQQVSLATRAMGWGVITFVLFSIKLAILALAGMFALALVFPLWLSGLIVAGAILVIEMITGLIAYQRFRQINLVPQRTMESVKEDIRWISSQLKSNGK